MSETNTPLNFFYVIDGKSVFRLCKVVSKKVNLAFIDETIIFIITGVPVPKNYP